MYILFSLKQLSMLSVNILSCWSSVGENLQTVQLEDGTTAYIAHMNTESLLTEAGNMDVPGISLDHLTQQVGSGSSSGSGSG